MPNIRSQVNFNQKKFASLIVLNECAIGETVKLPGFAQFAQSKFNLIIRWCSEKSIGGSSKWGKSLEHGGKKETHELTLNELGFDSTEITIDKLLN